MQPSFLQAHETQCKVLCEEQRVPYNGLHQYITIIYAMFSLTVNTNSLKPASNRRQLIVFIYGIVQFSPE